MNPTPQNPNDFKVVSFHNDTDFGFTPEMGCMFNGVAIHGTQGGPGINKGETMILPYHIAHQLALNLAKVKLNRAAPNTDPAGIPTGVPLWDDAGLIKLKQSFITDLYSEERPAPKTETELLMAKLEEYKKLTDERIAELTKKPVEEQAPKVPDISEGKIGYQDKAEVIAELEKRGIVHDKRQNKETLEKLLA